MEGSDDARFNKTTGLVAAIASFQHYGVSSRLSEMNCCKQTASMHQEPYPIPPRRTGPLRRYNSVFNFTRSRKINSRVIQIIPQRQTLFGRVLCQIQEVESFRTTDKFTKSEIKVIKQEKKQQLIIELLSKYADSTVYCIFL